VIGAFVIGFGLSMLVNRKSTKLKGLWRSVLFIAWVIPGVAKATIFKWILQTESGVLNDTLMRIGVIDSQIPWLSNSSFAIWSLVFVQIWSTAPYVMLIMTSSLQQVSRDLYESAELDGASWFQRLMHITLPLVKDACFVAILMLMIWSIGEFSLIWLTTSGGNNTTTLSILIYNQFRVMDINASAASAIMQLLVTMVFAIVYVRLVSKKD
jgi:ABC-type sugar transport system permease subunit